MGPAELRAAAIPINARDLTGLGDPHGTGTRFFRSSVTSSYGGRYQFTQLHSTDILQPITVTTVRELPC